MTTVPILKKVVLYREVSFYKVRSRKVCGLTRAKVPGQLRLTARIICLSKCSAFSLCADPFCEAWVLEFGIVSLLHIFCTLFAGHGLTLCAGVRVQS